MAWFFQMIGAKAKQLYLLLASAACLPWLIQRSQNQPKACLVLIAGWALGQEEQVGGDKLEFSHVWFDKNNKLNSRGEKSEPLLRTVKPILTVNLILISAAGSFYKIRAHQLAAGDIQ